MNVLYFHYKGRKAALSTLTIFAIFLKKRTGLDAFNCKKVWTPIPMGTESKSP